MTNPTELFPDAMGHWLQAVFAPPPSDSPPFVHDVTPRRCEACAAAADPECRDGTLYREGGEANDYYDVYAGRCGCACHRPKPSFTIETVERP
jgi:hypothetical protein